MRVPASATNVGEHTIRVGTDCFIKVITYGLAIEEQDGPAESVFCGSYGLLFTGVRRGLRLGRRPGSGSLGGTEDGPRA